MFDCPPDRDCTNVSAQTSVFAPLHILRGVCVGMLTLLDVFRTPARTTPSPPLSSTSETRYASRVIRVGRFGTDRCTNNAAVWTAVVSSLSIVPYMEWLNTFFRGVPLSLLAFVVNSCEMDGKVQGRWHGTSPCDNE